MSSLAQRVAQRTVVAKTFGSPEALEAYLRDHPEADRKHHKVDNKAKSRPQPRQKPGQRPKAPPPSGAGTKAPKAPEKPEPGTKEPKPEKLKGKAPPKDEAKPKAKQPERRFDGWKKTLKGLKDHAAKFVERAPKAIKSFLGDPDFRKNALEEAKTAVAKTPKKMVKNLIHTAKEEVHEFKTAAQGVNAMLHGKKMDKHQKHAFKAVATHIAIGAAAAAFAATGPLMGAAVFGKNLATHVALKSVTKALGNLHTLNEVSHVGHGIVHFLSHIAAEGENGKVDPEKAMANLVLASLAKEMMALEDDDFTRVLNQMEDEPKPKSSKPKSTNKTALAVLKRFS